MQLDLMIAGQGSDRKESFNYKAGEKVRRRGEGTNGRR